MFYTFYIEGSGLFHSNAPVIVNPLGRVGSEGESLLPYELTSLTRSYVFSC